MVRSRSVKGPGSARTEGARRATGVRADAAAGGAGALAPGQRWSASRKRDVVLRLLRGESLDAVSREVGVELYRLEAWKERALAGLELGLKDQAGEPAVAALDAAKRHIGERDPQLHDGTIITAAPHVMWGTDGVRVFTVDDGWVWTFAAVDHWNAECVGWHVCKVGNRFAALEPIAHGLRQRYGSVDADVARGLALRMDHGSQYLSDHFLHQIRYWGIRPSVGFLEEPETNGVAERWNRTLKEQAIYGRVFQHLDDVRAAVADFVERYNQSWRLEKLGYQTPIEAREAYELRPAA